MKKMVRQAHHEKVEKGLKYVGDGGFLPGIPARDLSAEEVKEYGLEWLLQTGLYEEIKEAE